MAMSFLRNARSVCSGVQPSSLALSFTRSSTTIDEWLGISLQRFGAAPAHAASPNITISRRPRYPAPGLILRWCDAKSLRNTTRYKERAVDANVDVEIDTWLTRDVEGLDCPNG